MKRIHTVLLLVYGLIGLMMAASSYPDSLISVSRYKLHVLWFMPDTSKARLEALLHDGHIGLFNLYMNIESLSFILICVSLFIGLLWGARDESKIRLMKIKPTLTLTVALFMLYALNTLLQRSLDDLADKGIHIELGLSAMPLYWLIGLIFSAGFTAHYIVQGAHDFALTMRQRFAG